MTRTYHLHNHQIVSVFPPLRSPRNTWLLWDAILAFLGLACFMGALLAAYIIF